MGPRIRYHGSFPPYLRDQLGLFLFYISHISNDDQPESCTPSLHVDKEPLQEIASVCQNDLEFRILEPVCVRGSAVVVIQHFLQVVHTSGSSSKTKKELVAKAFTIIRLHKRRAK